MQVHRREIAITAHLDLRVPFVFVGVARDGNVTIGRKKHRHANQFGLAYNAWNRVQLRKQTVKEGRLLLGMGVAALGKMNIGGENVLRLQSKICAAQSKETSRDQPGAGQQNKGKSHLSDYKSGSEPAMLKHC